MTAGTMTAPPEGDVITPPVSAFADLQKTIYKHEYEGHLYVHRLMGGIPRDPKVAEGWIQSKMGDKDEQMKADVLDRVREQISEAGGSGNGGGNGGVATEEMVEAAIRAVDENRHLTGFHRSQDGELYVEGRQLKAAIKEAALVALNAGQLKKSWGVTKKGVEAWFPEHVFVAEDRLMLGVTEPTDILQRFVHTKLYGSAISYNEFVADAEIAFTVEIDDEMTRKDWAAIWCRVENLGFGAVRSQGYGRCLVRTWEQLR